MAQGVVIADYGVGNLFSVYHALRHVGANPILSGDPHQIATADRLIVPGVGAFGKVMAEIRSRGIAEAVGLFRRSGRPLLGICVGMQMMMERSSELGDHEGLSFLRGDVSKIPSQSDDGVALRIPHIGWTELLQPAGVDQDRWTRSLVGAVEPGRSALYFVHSFAVRPVDASDILAEVIYGGHRIVAAVQRDNMTGVQFHPERSGLAGQKILRRFVAQ